MAETGTMSEQKRLGIAWGTTFAMVFSAVVAANVGAASEPAEAEAVLAAHKNFEESVATPVVAETTTSLKPMVEEADEKPELEQIPDTETHATTSDMPTTIPDEEVVEVEASAASAMSLIEPESPSESIGTETPEDPILQDVEVPEAEAISGDVYASEVAKLEVPSEVEQVEEVEVAASEPDFPPVTVLEVEEVESAVELADVSEQPDALDVVVSDDLIDDVPNVEAAPISFDTEPTAEDVIDEAPVVGAVAPPVAAISTNEAEQVSEPEATSLESSSPEAATPALTPTSVITPDPAVAAKPKLKSKPFFGVGIRNTGGSIVTTIYDGSTAQSLGIKLGDRLVSVNDQPVSSLEELRSALKGFEVDTPTSVEVERGGTKYQLGPKPLGAR